MSKLPPRPKHLPVAPEAAPAHRRLPLAGPTRPQDAVRPVYAVWELTLKCDLACRHCGSRAGRARPDELSTAEAIDLVEQMAALGIGEVVLIGGEAYLRPDWLEIVRACVANGIECNMTTGGRGVTAELARAGKAAGLSNVSVSIDGLEETHDALRGVRGAWRSAVAALGHLKAAGVAITSNTQIGRVNLPEVEAVYELLVELGAHTWQVQLTVPMGRAADEPERLVLQPWQVLEVIPRLAALKLRGNREGLRLFPGNNIGNFGPHEHTLRGSFPAGHMYSCGAGITAIGIEANGDIKGCPSLPSRDWVGGNVRDHSLQQIWEQTTPLRYTRDRTTKDLWGFCGSCYYADACRAGCTWTSHLLFGRPGNNPFCHHRALELARQGQKEVLRQTVPPDGAPFDQGIFELALEPLSSAELDAVREFLPLDVYLAARASAAGERAEAREVDC